MEIDKRTLRSMLYKDLESLMQRYYDEFGMSHESILGVLFRKLASKDDDEELTK